MSIDILTQPVPAGPGAPWWVRVRFPWCNTWIWSRVTLFFQHYKEHIQIHQAQVDLKRFPACFFSLHSLNCAEAVVPLIGCECSINVQPHKLLRHADQKTDILDTGEAHFLLIFWTENYRLAGTGCGHNSKQTQCSDWILEGLFLDEYRR